MKPLKQQPCHKRTQHISRRKPHKNKTHKLNTNHNTKQQTKDIKKKETKREQQPNKIKTQTVTTLSHENGIHKTTRGNNSRHQQNPKQITTQPLEHKRPHNMKSQIVNTKIKTSANKIKRTHC